MNTTISSLQAELEELEKRIKALSSAQTNLSTLLAIKDYFLKVQDYLTTLKDDFSNHEISCQEYSTQIQDLQDQINTINGQLNSDTSSTKLMEVLQPQITALQSDLEILREDFDTLTQNSDATMSSLENDISTLQTDIGYINDSIDELSAEISAINTTLGDHQTQINNLSSTQNTLTTAQSSLSSKVSGIDNRLTTAENNINKLTGGVDLTEYNNRLTNVESSQTIAYEEYEPNATISKTQYFTNVFLIKHTPNTPCHIEVDVYYKEASGNCFFYLYNSNGAQLTSDYVSLTDYPGHYVIKYYLDDMDVNGYYLRMEPTQMKLLKYSFKLTGTNAVRASHSHKLNYNYFDELNYTLSKNKYPQLYLYCTAKNQSASPSTSPYIDITNYNNTCFTYLPKLSWDENHNLQKVGEYVIYSVPKSITVFELDLDHQIISTTKKEHTYIKMEFYINGNENCDIMCYAVGNTSYGFVGTLSNLLTTGYLSIIKVNGANDTTKILTIMPVKNTRLSTQNTENFSYGFITTTVTGENYYHISEDAPNKIFIGEGTKPHAYTRDNGDIVVYLNNTFDKLYVYRLKYDSSTSLYTTTYERIAPCRGYECVEKYATDLICAKEYTALTTSFSYT